MESYQIEHLTFAYPGQAEPALQDITLTIGQGEFVVLCGKSGCGKTTLLRQLKPSLAPYGERSGVIYFEGEPLETLDAAQQSARIGFVLQSPEHQLVTDKVWHELAFGLESLGCPTPEIRARVAEMASFFGIQTWFHKSVTELSGGQKQLLNLASVMVMQPSVLLLDEPTSQLDPIAAQDFLETLAKINRELGTTIVLSEHRLEEALPMAGRALVLDGGKVLADGSPRQLASALKGHEMYAALPTPMRIAAAVEAGTECPVTVREGREWLEAVSKARPLDAEAIPPEKPQSIEPPVLEVKEVWFRYEREQADVLRGLSMTVGRGELYAIVGGNGTGKTTALSVIGGLRHPQRGRVRWEGQPIGQKGGGGRARVGMLPQDPQTLFVKKTVRLDLLDMLAGEGLSEEEQETRLREVAVLCQLDGLLERHPYDISGGEQQRAALAKVLLRRPRLLLLDEPTKGLDAAFKETLADILYGLKKQGVTIVVVSHDIEFCARYADRCAVFFDGGIVSEGMPRAFFAGKSFYTTAANRMARLRLPRAVLAEDVIAACGGDVPPRRKPPVFKPPERIDAAKPSPEPLSRTGPSRKNVVWGCCFGALFIVTAALSAGKTAGWRGALLQIFQLLELALCLGYLLPQRLLPGEGIKQKDKRVGRRLSKRTLAAVAAAVVAVPVTLFAGTHWLGDRKYYFISLLILLETLLPFCLLFEGRGPKARELVIISVLCALAVAGRAAFFMLPQFKPVAALVIIAGVCFGGETGFLVGAVTGFVSNFFFGQGPWTPWQMFALGCMGLLAGLLFQKGYLRRTRGSLCGYGGLAALLIYGGLMNPASVLMSQANPTWAAFLSGYLLGLPFDLIHAASTVFFLWFLAVPMLEKLERVKQKYGLMDEK